MMEDVMSDSLRDALELWLKKNRDSMVEDIMALTRVRSVVGPREGDFPFGRECARVLDVAAEIGRRRGFDFENHAHYCATTVLPGKGSKTIGMFGHLDVVPEGKGWTTPPFEPVVRDGHIFGRGPGDNKGPAIAALCLLQFIREQGIPFDHSLMLFYGTCEEAGMDDLVWYLKHFAPPDIGVVPDGTFPVCIGEKGRLVAKLTTSIEGSNIVSFHGGDAANAFPETATIVLSGVSADAARGLLGPDFTVEETGEGVAISTEGIVSHAANPETGVSAIHKIACALRGTALLNPRAEAVIAALAKFFSSPFGAGLGIGLEDDVSGRLTMVGGMVRTQDGILTQSLHARYPVKTNQDEMLESLRTTAGAEGFSVEIVSLSNPCYLSPDHPLATTLTDTFREFFGEDLTPFVSGGGTYAGKLPLAVAFGARLMSRPRPGGDRKGGGHQVDECVSIEGMEDMIRVYLPSLLRLDKLEMPSV